MSSLGLRTCAVIEDITDSYSTSVGGFMVDTFTSLGGELVAIEEAQNGDNDFRAQLTKIAAKQPDVLFVPWNYENVALIAQQAREVGITAVLFGADGWDTTELTELANGALEGCYYVSRPGFNLPEAAAYGEIYAAEYNVALETECLYGNDGLKWIQYAIETAGSDDPTAILDALEATESCLTIGRSRRTFDSDSAGWKRKCTASVSHFSFQTSWIPPHICGKTDNKKDDCACSRPFAEQVYMFGLPPGARTQREHMPIMHMYICARHIMFLLIAMLLSSFSFSWHEYTLKNPLCQ